MTIQTICFDADGVIVNPQMQFSRHLKEAHGISPEMTQGFFRGVFNDCLVGKANLVEVLPEFSRAWGWHDSVDNFIHTWLLTDHLIDMRLIEAVQRLRRAGIICCLTTSQERHRAEYMKTRMGFQDFFDRLFFSCEVGYQKPDHLYFQHVQTALGLEKKSILFWDDLPGNIAAARAFGWKAEIYTDFDKFQTTLRTYLAMDDA